MSDPLLSQEEIDALRRSLEREEETPRLGAEAAEALADLFARALEEALRQAAPSLLDAGAQVDGEEAPPSRAAAAVSGQRVSVAGGGMPKWEGVLWLGPGPGESGPLFEAWCRQLGEALSGVLAGSVQVLPGDSWSPGETLPAEPIGFLFHWQGGGEACEAGLVAPMAAVRSLVETATHPKAEGAAPARKEPEPAGDAGAGTGGATPRATQAASNPHVWQPLDAPRPGQSPAGLELLYDVPLEITVELGRASKSVREVLALGTGSVVELDRAAGEPVDILVNGKLVAHGE
ncbi:MAG: FliM/FliN family flagellar motor switch protein, partial [Bacillota bacterium]|nr:FliM/FliN family flagellar motor switch protein [Bacillota bacterium]